ncbi:hypothetical protein PPERSA_08987 [Pseudocohnilembus persalinus]|uniref:Uncharacterized protein n=1 Tax=Pseudocohnilembus persalinus TaxID=266149 RepID=A0A0V0R2Z0_PSEPJ|nr:hypothetical protein PPERSA_08987 [Pseudocohnilembus persalinus]|eukprot:KRX08883.1 hypothetical protein PPERSA_08987 [Pseudocohnilembus persalinus]
MNTDIKFNLYLDIDPLVQLLFLKDKNILEFVENKLLKIIREADTGKDVSDKRYEQAVKNFTHFLEENLDQKKKEKFRVVSYDDVNNILRRLKNIYEDIDVKFFSQLLSSECDSDNFNECQEEIYRDAEQFYFNKISILTQNQENILSKEYKDQKNNQKKERIKKLKDLITVLKQNFQAISYFKKIIEENKDKIILTEQQQKNELFKDLNQQQQEYKSKYRLNQQKQMKIQNMNKEKQQEFISKIYEKQKLQKEFKFINLEEQNLISQNEEISFNCQQDAKK